VQTQGYPIESFLNEAVRNSYEGKLGILDPEITNYVSRLLSEFSEYDKLYKMRDEMGHPIEELAALFHAADPIGGSATSFDVERDVRKYIGDYALFVAGLHPELIDPSRGCHPSLGDLIRAGKESYFIVSQFNLFEYQEEARLFARLSEGFELLVLGLKLVSDELGPGKPQLLQPAVQ
jgi:hypothetical protein